MPTPTSRRDFLASASVLLPAYLRSPTPLVGSEAKPVETATITNGDLKALMRDNSQSPKVLSGIDSLFHTKDAPSFDAFDPDSPGASAGLNFEHIISGHKNKNNAFTPRHGKYDLIASPDGKSAKLIRKKENDPWSMSSTLTYTITPPHFIDMDFRCIPHDKTLFGERGYAILFFANYMNDVEQVALHFRGIEGPNRPETWIAADAPKGHADWNQGGTYRSKPAADLQYDGDHNFKLNSWSFDYPRFTKPFYFGRAGKGMVFMLMFDKMWTDVDEIRFSLFKFKLRKFPRPAWDFQYVIRSMQEGMEYGFKARVVWKKFVSADDCVRESERWAAEIR